MSEDETFILIVSLAIGAFTWIVWYRRGARLSSLVKRGADRRVLYTAPLVCALGLLAVLLVCSASDVRNDARYVFLYLSMGAAWVGTASFVVPLFGISVRDDVFERGNRAAGLASGGALMGITACFAGGNIGNGPGWWVVVYCALLSTGTLFILWSVFEKLTHVSDAVTIERDVASALRLGGWLAALGLILGRAVAGDWESADKTTVDFARFAWPAIVLLALAIVLQRALRPSRETPQPPALSHGLVPCALHLAVAIGWLMWIGPWS